MRLLMDPICYYSQFWGGMTGKNGRSKYYKIVMSPCSGGEIVSFYCMLSSHMLIYSTYSYFDLQASCRQN